MLEKISEGKMLLKHRCIKSPVFKLIDVYEFDIEFPIAEDDVDSFSIKIELFQSTKDQNIYRYKIWRNEYFRIQSTSPQNEFGDPEHQPSDEDIIVRLSLPHLRNSGEIFAKNSDEAFKIFIDNLNKSFEHITSERIEIE
jgi:hypothetical protein